MTQILDYGEVRRGELGVLIRDLTPELAESLGLDLAGGAVIAAVMPGSAAESAGLRKDDVVVALDGEAVRNAAELRNEVGLLPPGRKIRLEILREGRRRNVEVVIREARD